MNLPRRPLNREGKNLICGRWNHNTRRAPDATADPEISEGSDTFNGRNFPITSEKRGGNGGDFADNLRTGPFQGERKEYAA